MNSVSNEITPNTKSDTMLVIPGFNTGQNIYESASSLIYHAVRLQDRQPVILKVLKYDNPRPEEPVHYRQEYELLSRLNAAGVITVYGLESYRNNVFLILEDFGGVSLNQLMKDWGHAGTAAFPLPQFLNLAHLMVEALDQIHAKGIIHTNINPSNIVYNPDNGVLKLIDFGLATTLSRETPTLKSPQALQVSLSYLSPEQTGRMNRTVDYRTDFYSLGVTFYELLTGRLPFDATDDMELVHYHLAKTPVAPHILNQTIPQVLSDIVLKMMAKAPEDRYQSVRGLQYDLDMCQQYWQARGDIPDFDLGRKDRAERFLIPEKLYGRAAEVETLLAAFERVAQGSIELILVAGSPGIGKTTVIQEVHKPITRQHGYFIKGKFDQLKHSIPFSAFVEALRDLTGQLLNEENFRKEQWKSRILNMLGENAQIIIDVIPELEEILGHQPAVPELSGSAAQNRFNLLFQSFLATFTKQEHPLVIFLDDLQWADAASLMLMQKLMSEAKMECLLLIGAYRDNEVSLAHPLSLALTEIQKSGTVLGTIRLTPLQLSDINQLIADALTCSLEAAFPLTDLVYRITKGNPFFNNQLLKSLYEEGLIVLNRETGSWQCNVALVNALPLTDNIVEFLVLQLQKFPSSTQEVISMAASIGNSFDLKTLAIVCQRPPIQISADLWPALQAGLIVSPNAIFNIRTSDGQVTPDTLDSNTQFPVYRFLHDRVQQAIYSTIAANRKQSVHLQIGRLLLSNSTTVEQDERLFEIVNHLNIGHSLMDTSQEQENLAQLNLRAGRKAKTSTAYHAAIEYLTAGIHLLPPDGWERCYDLTLALHQEITESAYLNADYDQIEHWATPVLHHARTLLEKFKITETKIMSVRGQGRILVALRMGMEALQSLGIEFPESPTQTDIEQAFRATRKLWEDQSPLRLLELPVMDDPVRLAAMRMMTILSPSAYSAVPAFMPLLTCKQVELSILYGNCSMSPSAYAVYGMLLCGVIGDLETGYEFGQLALKLLERLQAMPYKCRTEMLVHHFISHWKDPLRQVLPHLLEAYQSGLTTGDLEAASYSAQIYCLYSFFAGRELAGLVDEMEAYRHTIHIHKQETALKYLEIIQQAVLNLLGGSLTPWELTGSVYNAKQSLPLLQVNSNLTALFHFHFNQTFLYYLFGRYSLAARQSALMEQYLDSTPGQFMIPLHTFYDSLIHLALYDESTAEQKEQIQKRVQMHQAKMRRWAALAPFNHQHRWELVEAELYRVLGQRLEAMEMYDHAIRNANIHGYTQDEALANELAARFYLSWGKEKAARVYMQEAYSGYTCWGASAKAAHLEHHYKSLLAPLPGATAPLPVPVGEGHVVRPVSVHLDLVTVVKASQAIAGEIELDRLLREMMRIALENAGAEYGALILERNGEWVIEAQADVNREINVLQAQILKESPAVSAEIVFSVARTNTSIVLDDAVNKGDFTRDPSIIRRGVKSVLCVPLINQGRLSGMLYLENNLTTGAFTADRLELLNLLSTQMALSLDNARLYQDAQHELAERKQAEEEKARLEEQLIQAQKMESIGRLAGGVAHDFNNMLTIILGYAEFLKSELHGDASLLKYVKEIEKAGMHSRDITRQLLAFSRKQIIAPKTINLNDLIERTNKTLSRLIGEDVELQFYPEKELWKVKFDPSQIDQILINLAVNAHDAMPDGGMLTITTANVSLDEAYCRENIESKPGQFVLLEITDSGFGMDKETITHIFEPFFTTKEVDKGTGLGLATVYGIVKQNNGFINLYSEPGLGTTFKIYIPGFVEEGETEEKIVEPRFLQLWERFCSSRTIIWCAK